MKLVVLLAALLSVQCATSPRGRYVMATDPGSRYGFQYVRDRTTGRWVHREFEIRVDLERTLPELLKDADIGNRFSVQLFRPETAQTGGLFSAVPVAQDGFRVWRGADVIDKADLVGKAAYGVSVSWPEPGRETKVEPMEVFSLPPLDDTAPEEWSAWATAATLRAGAFGWWDQTAGNPVTPAPAPDHPFELRWRLVYAEIPGRIP
jgi:hypothetical protein